MGPSRTRQGITHSVLRAVFFVVEDKLHQDIVNSLQLLLIRNGFENFFSVIFHDAENVTTNGVKATILAPNSNIKATANHHQEGQVVAHSLKGDLKIGTTLFSLDASRTIENTISNRSGVQKQNSDPWLDRVNAFLGIAPEPVPEPVKEEAPAAVEEAASEPKDYGGMFEALMAALSAAAVLGFAADGHSRKTFAHFA